mgnify:CR=1 FL=1
MNRTNCKLTHRLLLNKEENWTPTYNNSPKEAKSQTSIIFQIVDDKCFLFWQSSVICLFKNLNLLKTKLGSNHHTNQNLDGIKILRGSIVWFSSIGCVPCRNGDFSTNFHRNSSWSVRKSKFIKWSFLYQIWCITIILEKITWSLHSFQIVVSPVQKGKFRANNSRNSWPIVQYGKFNESNSVLECISTCN